MDFIQDYLPLLQSFLPPSLLTTLLKTITTTFGLLKTLQTHLSPFIARLTTSPDVTTLLLLAITLFLSFKILDMAYRAVMFWVRLVVRVAFYGSIVGVGLWVYSRGVDGFVEDVGGLMGFWAGEYERFSGDVKAFRREKEREIWREQGVRGGRIR
ncbi:nuclear pore assembly and biogenesis-domain-containing protein [Dendryphion nanum]|uniref:Nuclear pore assembly and biogenesis-domain-containing protein n=1 Tax=Dendryphion nanum TaxID=256645 RepID=A0A9P9IAR9_9PLEO|nr:nuclear pore assembly and biogenesis-domain-containing protein [Dendryphion nanum]